MEAQFLPSRQCQTSIMWCNLTTLKSSPSKRMCQFGDFHLIAGCKVKKRYTLIMVTKGTVYNYCNIEAVCNKYLQSQWTVQGWNNNMEWIYFLDVTTLKTEDKICSALPQEGRQWHIHRCIPENEDLESLLKWLSTEQPTAIPTAGLTSGHALTSLSAVLQKTTHRISC